VYFTSARLGLLFSVRFDRRFHGARFGVPLLVSALRYRWGVPSALPLALLPC